MCENLVMTLMSDMRGECCPTRRRAGNSRSVVSVPPTPAQPMMASPPALQGSLELQQNKYVTPNQGDARVGQKARLEQKSKIEISLQIGQPAASFQHSCQKAMLARTRCSAEPAIAAGGPPGPRGGMRSSAPPAAALTAGAQGYPVLKSQQSQQGL